ncbi:PA0069 family radical SAM protein [Ideonella dechloratans]|uniref:PA0069 family radical SAM protein n=1 Tax=Ideonella dechloratans TaxID=36863 RepID=A0A643FDF4_IDEDE|nr:PA0069 family radical SAM protein [Ideonella dechloratans]KAB0579935.1 PA0069 family radical SAM protein [Ideonella dechloratans]UFU08839.1 PA0069 family radical SAM protein [Ideonella dechloratans]
MPSTRVSPPAAAPVARKGRGTVWRIQPRFDGLARQDADDGWGGLENDHLRSEEGGAAPATVIVEEQVRSILSRNDSPDVGFDLSINPYRGCEHGCIYCYARPTHSYLGLSPGLDFETHIVGKVNAAERLRQALTKPGYRPVALNIGSVTDAYQPAERRLQITRALIEVLAEFRHPFSIITKSAGILRDIDLLAPLAAQGLVAVYLSVTTLDPALARILEPRAASPRRRLQAMSALAQAGIPVGVSVSPVIPFLNEPDIEHIVEAAAQAGACTGFSIPLRLPWEVAPLFEQWLGSHFPERAGRVMARLRDMRGGKINDARFGHRMRGEGVWADLLRQRFAAACRRHGLRQQRIPLDDSRFQAVPSSCGAEQGPGEAPAGARQMTLF